MKTKKKKLTSIKNDARSKIGRGEAMPKTKLARMSDVGYIQLALDRIINDFKPWYTPFFINSQVEKYKYWRSIQNRYPKITPEERGKLNSEITMQSCLDYVTRRRKKDKTWKTERLIEEIKYG